MANKRISRLLKILSGAATEAEDDFFELEGHFERITYFWVHVYKSFIRNRCMIRASALSYTSLLALIPLLAVAISVTSALLKKEGEEKIYQGIDKFVAAVVPPAPDATNVPVETLSLTNKPVSVTNSSFAVSVNTNQAVALASTNSPAGTNQAAAALASLAGDKRVVTAQKSAAKSIHEFVQRTQSGALGVTGMLVLVFVAIRLLANIEATFNDIWGITRGRSWVWRIVLYWTTITLGPLALVGAVGLAGSSQLHSVNDFFQTMPYIGSLVFEFIPVVLLWLIFAVIYLLVPNTKVKFSAALVGGIVAGSAWHLNNVFGFLFASRLVTNSKIYGSLALVPVFMVGLYFSWVILLFGAQVAFAFQNRKSYLQEKLVVHVNQRGREFVALRLMTSLGQRFHEGIRSPSIFQLSSELNIPAPLAQSVLRTLVFKQLVTEIAGSDPAYAPARPLNNITAHDILQAMRTGTGQELPLHDAPALAAIYGEFGRIEQAERNAASAISLQALVNRMPAVKTLEAPEASRAEEEPAGRDSLESETVQTSEPEEPPAPEPTQDQVTTSKPEVAGNAESGTITSAEQAKTDPKHRAVVVPEENREFPL